MNQRIRITSIDLLRGLVMILMALDHVRDYFHADAFLFDPTDLSQTNVPLFFTRFITHFCAPVFMFLAGTSAFFVGNRLSKKELSVWLLKRGLWLIIVEITIVKFAWMFQLDMQNLLLMVIWALGISMICLAALIYMPKKLAIILALVMVFGHNLADGYQPAAESAWPIIWHFLHLFGEFPLFGGLVTVFIGYPIIPWVAVMLLGYHFGEFYKTDYPSALRIKYLKWIGFSATGLFIILRFANVYGDPVPWETQSSMSFSILSFFNVSKYPPSLLYLLVTLGPSLLFLAYFENTTNWFSQKLIIIGRVPMFYYIIHLYVIHLVALIAAVAMGFPASGMVIDVWINFQSQLTGYGFNLFWTYIFWIGIVISIYPLAAWFNSYKNNNRDKWWLSYL